MRGSNSVAKGSERSVGALVAHFDQKKSMLGDTCPRLVQAKQQAASSNIKIYGPARGPQTKGIGGAGTLALIPAPGPQTKGRGGLGPWLRYPDHEQSGNRKLRYPDLGALA